MTIKDRIEAMKVSIRAEEEIIGKSRDRLRNLRDELDAIIDSVQRGTDALSKSRRDLNEAIEALYECRLLANVQ